MVYKETKEIRKMILKNDRIKKQKELLSKIAADINEDVRAKAVKLDQGNYPGYLPSTWYSLFQKQFLRHTGEKEVEIFSDPCHVIAEVGLIQGMSAHGDTDDLIRFISNQNPEKVRTVFLVHGEHAVQKAFADRLSLKGFKNVEIPEQHQQYDLSAKQIKLAVHG